MLAPATGLPSGVITMPESTLGTSLISTVPLPAASIVCGAKPFCSTVTTGMSGIFSKWKVPSAAVVVVTSNVGATVAVIGAVVPGAIATGIPGMAAPV